MSVYMKLETFFSHPQRKTTFVSKVYSPMSKNVFPHKYASKRLWGGKRSSLWNYARIS